MYILLILVESEEFETRHPHMVFVVYDSGKQGSTAIRSGPPIQSLRSLRRFITKRNSLHFPGFRRIYMDGDSKWIESI